jgi:hypothetical protein
MNPLDAFIAAVCGLVLLLIFVGGVFELFRGDRA